MPYGRRNTATIVHQESDVFVFLLAAANTLAMMTISLETRYKNRAAAGTGCAKKRLDSVVGDRRNKQNKQEIIEGKVNCMRTPDADSKATTCSREFF